MEDDDDARETDCDDDDAEPDQPANPALHVIRQLVSEANRQQP